MDLRVIRYFISTVRAGSITKAAADLCLTQPTLTRQIKELEDELGHELIKRSRHGITLTEKGLQFYERAVELMDMAKRIKEEVQGSVELRGTVTIIAAEAPAMRVLARAMARFNTPHPFVRFDVISATRDIAFSRLEAGSCDFGMVVPVPGAAFDYINLRSQAKWGLIVTKDSPLWACSSLHVQQLRGIPLLVSKANVTSGFLDAWLGFPLSKLRFSATFSLLNNALIMCEEGLGAVMTFEGIINPLPPQFKFIPFEPAFVSSAFLTWKKARPLTPAAQLFIKYVREEIEKLPQIDAVNSSIAIAER
ncbi:MAG: LysR family transcriptional regulator [Candidatus Anaerobiospirillum merdipullorum]|uniref:LysR family transcriptional regulator n=1 Tax=Candidatus Anaerobiospirillum merdipullorum TaxID=2838450 RepID=A0A9E2KPP5_9GAMM|nr:LysR family transcriptional regulator [Candidatus Anaerobiospirillum merdipullorum]